MFTKQDTRGFRLPGASGLENNIVGIARNIFGTIKGFALYGEYTPKEEWDEFYEKLRAADFDITKIPKSAGSDDEGDWLYDKIGLTVLDGSPLTFTQNIRLVYPDSFTSEDSHSTHDNNRLLAGILFVKNYSPFYKGVEFSGGTQLDIKLRIMVRLKKPIKAVDILPRPLLVLDSLIRSAVKSYCIKQDLVEFLSKSLGEKLQDGLVTAIEERCVKSADECGYELSRVTFEDIEFPGEDTPTGEIIKSSLGVQKATQDKIAAQEKIGVKKAEGQAAGAEIAGKADGEARRIEVTGKAQAAAAQALLEAQAEGYRKLREILGSDFVIVQQAGAIESLGKLQPGATLVVGSGSIIPTLPINPGVVGDKKAT